MTDNLIIKKNYYNNDEGCLNISDKEVLEICELDALCYEPGIEYDEDNIRFFLSEKGCLLIRFYENDKLIAFQLSNINKRELTTIDVHPDFRRNGLGRKVLKTTLKEFIINGCNKVHCQIATNNLASINLHLRFGFKPLFIIKGYYPNGDSAYWFEKKFTKEEKIITNQ